MLKKIIAFPFLAVLTLAAIVTLFPICIFIGLVGGIPLMLTEWWSGESTEEGYSFFIYFCDIPIEFIKVLWGMKA